MQKRKIILNKEKETLLVPLYGKALESKKESPIIYDAMAIEIVGRLNYDFTSLKIPGKTNTMMCLRAKLIDNFVSDFLSTEQKSVALHSTFLNVGNNFKQLLNPISLSSSSEKPPSLPRFLIITGAILAMQKSEPNTIGFEPAKYCHGFNAYSPDTSAVSKYMFF
jgi:hypothetical protein